ncbi:hypothetical protein HZA97_09185 [Candidatus Woesearchaeota archaeon]|nr:hypothetical protein [Candidatus Woesearchaeota archaeon]
MAINPSVVQDLHKLNEFVHRVSEKYLNSRPLAVSKTGIVLPEKTKHPFKIEYDIKDLFVIGAATESSVLMTGGTDLGKTTLAKLMLNALFGKEETGWHRLDVDTDFGKDSFSDVDFSVITDGKKMSEGFYGAAGFLKLPGLILDEINRTHAKLGNKLLHFFDKDITLPDGKRVMLGHPLGDGTSYQFHITAINEGEEYGGTFGIDKALRRRTVIEIPMDVFRPIAFDRLQAQKNDSTNIELTNEDGSLEQILKINKALKEDLTLHPIAELFVAYLESFDYCKHSLTGEKGGVATRGGSIHHVCTQPARINEVEISGAGVGCEFLKSFENNLCPYVRGLSMGVSKNLRKVAKGFAVLRAAKFVELIGGYIQGVNVLPLSYEIEKPELFTQSLRQ